MYPEEDALWREAYVIDPIDCGRGYRKAADHCDETNWHWNLLLIDCNGITHLPAAVLYPDRSSLFRSRQRANVLLLRSRRANAFLLEEILQGNLERECFEERCNKEEAREYFENDQKTDVFWENDGDQCQSNPCKHGGTCRDGIGGYTCTCAEMYSGTNCQTDKSQCPSAGTLACEHFCKPMTDSYRCLCARGYTLNSDGRSCSPHGT
uniref:Protein Z, vitamin K-dependent plasma glycoprotein b n=1 Tax=Cyprinus carpio TaxID=7962 RepID=A0A8C1R3H9_CYPCA